VSRRYGRGDAAVDALRDATVEFERGRLTAVMGPSGSGKSTLMHILAGLDRPTSGSVEIDGVEITRLKERRLTKLRRDRVGFIFQSFNLLPQTSALENVAAPLLYQGVGQKERLARARATLERLGLGDRLTHQPSELSGGQQQRVGIARALVTEPQLLLADEPTGNLDSHAGSEVITVFRALHAAGSTIVLITHDTEVAAAASRQVHLRDGRIAA